MTYVFPNEVFASFVKLLRFSPAHHRSKNRHNNYCAKNLRDGTWSWYQDFANCFADGNQRVDIVEDWHYFR